MKYSGCHVAADVSEKATRESTTICREFGARRKHVFTSKTHAIRITAPRSSISNKNYNMLEYEGKFWNIVIVSKISIGGDGINSVSLGA